jgi:hypothetical protein
VETPPGKARCAPAGNPGGFLACRLQLQADCFKYVMQFTNAVTTLKLKWLPGENLFQTANLSLICRGNISMSRQYRSGITNSLLLTGSVALLAACGGGGGGGDSTGTLSVGVTDLPTTGDEVVCLHFTGITLHHSDGERIVIPYDIASQDPASYDPEGECVDNVDPALGDPSNNTVAISALQGELSTQLMDTETVKAGRYNWIRLDVDEALSYVVPEPGAESEALRCPSCAAEQSGLKLNRGIVVPAGGEARFTIDFDLAKSLKLENDGGYKLDPVLRLVDNAETGTITGTVEMSLLPVPVEGVLPDDSGCRVYVWQGHGVPLDDLHDMDNVLTTARIVYNTDRYEYVAAYLPTDTTADPVPYTVALTCDLDYVDDTIDIDADQNNDPLNLVGMDVIFTDGVTDGVGQETGLATGQTQIVNFPPAPL